MEIDDLIILDKNSIKKDKIEVEIDSIIKILYSHLIYLTSMRVLLSNCNLVQRILVNILFNIN